MLNPMRSEGEAFRLLLYAVATTAVIVGRDRDPARDPVSAAGAT